MLYADYGKTDWTAAGWQLTQKIICCLEMFEMAVMAVIFNIQIECFLAILDPHVASMPTTMFRDNNTYTFSDVIWRIPR